MGERDRVSVINTDLMDKSLLFEYFQKIVIAYGYERRLVVVFGNYENYQGEQTIEIGISTVASDSNSYITRFSRRKINQSWKPGDVLLAESHCKQHYCYEYGRHHLLDLLKHHTEDIMESEEGQVTMPPPSQTSTQSAEVIASESDSDSPED